MAEVNAVATAPPKQEVTRNQMVDNMLIADYKNYDALPSSVVLQCGHEAMEAVSNIFDKNLDAKKQFMQDTKLRRTTIEGIKRAAILNLSTANKECYFMTRGTGTYMVMEMNIYGDGYRKLLSTFGDGVAKLYPEWYVCEGDEFTPPAFSGIEIQPPKYTPRYKTKKCQYVVLPVKFTDGSVDYSIVERNDIMKNIFACVKQKLMYSKDEGLKQAIFDKLNACETVDDMLACPEAKPYINAVYFDYPEEMIRRKMLNKAIRKYKLNLTPIVNKAFVQSEPEYSNTMSEIAENENSTPLVVDGEGEIIAE